MDGSYQNPYHRANSPLSPETPTSAPYRANVNRTKTRKWVEAKTQNYDGDDWGGDDFGDEPEPVPVPPLRPTGSRQTSLSSQTWKQPPPVPQAGPRYASGPQPSLHIQTQPAQSQPQPQSQPESQPQQEFQPQQPPLETAPPSAQTSSDMKSPVVPEPSSSVYSQGTGQVVSPQSASSGGPTVPLAASEPSRFPPRKSSIGQYDREPAQQQSKLPSDIQRRSEEDRIAEDSHPSPDAGVDVGRGAIVEQFATSQGVHSQDQREASTQGRGSLGSTPRGGTPQETTTGGKSDYGFDTTPSQPQFDQGQVQQAPAPASAPVPAPAPAPSRTPTPPPASVEQTQPSNHYNTTVIAELQATYPSGRFEVSSPTTMADQSGGGPPGPQEEPRRFSTSPQLPSLARMSMFGDDFFSKPPPISDAPPVPTVREESVPSPQLPVLSSQNSPSLGGSATSPGANTGTVLGLGETESPTQPTDELSNKAEGSSTVQTSNPETTTLSSEGADNRDSPRPERAEQKRPSFPGGWVTETVTPAAEAEPTKNPIESAQITSNARSDISLVSDSDGDAPGTDGSVVVKERQSIKVPLPGATPSEDSVPGGASPDGAASSGSHSVSVVGPHGSSMPAPLQTRTLDDPPENFVAPERLQRESTLSTINSPSPIKESDKLREEIIRTLSPVRPTHDHDVPGDNKGTLSAQPPAGRESTYLHGVYDDYWSGPDDRPSHDKQQESEPVPAIPATDGTMLSSPRGMSDIPPLSPRSPRRDPIDQPAEASEIDVLPRRFSWEGNAEDKPEPTALGSAGSPPPSFAIDAGGGPQSPQTQVLAPTVEEPKDAPGDEDKPPSSAADELPSRLAQNTNMGILDNTALVSHQVSQVSTLPREKQESDAPEPPSPISAASEKPPSFSTEPEPKRLVEPRRLSLADEKRPLQVTSSNPTSPLPSPDGHPALAEPTSSTTPEAEGSTHQQQLPAQPAQKLLSFREILDLPSAADRIAKYNETRAQFAAMDSGLSNWMVGLQSQHPEHGAASSSYHTSVATGPQGGAPAQRSPTNAPSASQQPYYQQYLNASSPSVNPGASGRPSTGNITAGGAGAHSPSSDFKHSSGQVGAKGKELLLGAAKAGKGLLSKGKNKLRGGDKNEESSSSSSPPPPPMAQSKARNDRRASWGLSLGPRSSGPKGDAGPQSHPPQPRRLSTVSSSAPQIPQPLRLSPLDTFPNQDGVPWATSQAQARPRTPPNGTNVHQDSQSELVSPVSDTHSMHKARHGDDNDEDNTAGKLQVPRPISKTQPTWDPTNATPLFEENDFDLDHSHPSNVPHGRPAASAEDRDDDWVVVEPEAPGEPYRMVPPGSNKPSAPDPAVSSAPSAQGPQSNASQPRQPPPETSPQRNSSFIGLPPIRRSSTFGLNYARRAKERFSLDEDEMDDFSRTPTLDAAAGPSTLASQQQQQQQQQQQHQQEALAVQETGSLANRSLPTGSQTRDSQQGLAGDTLGASTLGRTASNASSEVDVGEDPEKTPLVEPAPYQNRRNVPNQSPNLRLQQGGLGQNGPGGNPVQHLPPQGPWKLEESHLSEPLLPASRSRQVSDPHQQYFGFDKETGVPTPIPMQPRPTIQMPPRQKFSETPPSSARRYPELFSRAPGGQQQQHLDQGGPRTSQDLPPHMYQEQPPSREDVILQRSNTSEFQVPGVGPPQDEDRGRDKRTSGFFKDIGGRFRAASRERRGSHADDRSPAMHPGADMRGDEVSESSFDTQEIRDRKKKRRSSFFMNLRGSKPTTSDGQPVASGDDIASSSDATEPVQTQAHLQQQFADQRKRSFFGSAAGGGLGLPTLSRTSTASNMHDPEGSVHSTNSPKKRLSTLTNKFFHRSPGQVEEPPKPMTAQSLTPSLQSRHSGLPNTQPGVPSPLADHGGERSGVTGSRPVHNQEPHIVGHGAPDDAMHEDRGRRASAGGFLAGLLGHRSSSKPREAHPQPGGLQQQQPQAQQAHFQTGKPPAQAQATNMSQHPGMNDTHTVSQQPPPFRTQGPPVHPIAGVANPNYRGQGSFPDPYKAPESTRVSVQQVEPETDEMDSDDEQQGSGLPGNSRVKSGIQSQAQTHTPDHVPPPSQLNSATGQAPSTTVPSTQVSPNASPDLSSGPQRIDNALGGRTESMPFSPDHVRQEQHFFEQGAAGSRHAAPQEPSDLSRQLANQPAQQVQAPNFVADLRPPRDHYSPSPQLQNGHLPPPSEASLQDRRVSHLSVGSLQESSGHSSPNLPSQVDLRAQRPVSISPVPQAMHQPPGYQGQARASAPPPMTQPFTQQHGPPAFVQGQASGVNHQAAAAMSTSQEPQDGRRSRWLMVKPSQQSITQSQPKPEKEKSARSLFSAFKRSSKVPAANQVQPDLAAYRTDSRQEPPMAQQQQQQMMMQARPQNLQQGQQQRFTPDQQQQQRFSPDQQQQQRFSPQQQQQGFSPQQQQQQFLQQQNQVSPGLPQQFSTGPPQQFVQSQGPPLSHSQLVDGQVHIAPHHQYQQQRMSPANVPVPGSMSSRQNSFVSQHQPRGQSPEIGQRNSQHPPQQNRYSGPETSNMQMQPSRAHPGPGGQQLMQNVSANTSPYQGQHPVQQRQQQPPQPFIEPQYDQVPIPKGYEAVHGEGNIAPSPYSYGRRVSGGFQRPSYEEHLGNDAGSRRQFSAEQLHRPHSQTQPTSHHTVSPPLEQQPGFRDSMASSRSSYHPHQGGQQGGPVMRSGPPLQPNQGVDRAQAGYGGSAMQSHDANGMLPRASQNMKPHTVAQATSRSQPGVQQNGFARPPPTTHLHGQGRTASNISIDTGMSTHVQAPPPQQQRQTSHIPPNAPRAAAGGMSNSNPSTPAGRNLNINVQSANQGDHDDIYDSTPRRPMEPLRAAKTGDSQVSAGSGDEQQALKSRQDSEAETSAKTTLVRGKSTRAELEDTEDERKRSIRLEAQEEKILYDPDEDNDLATGRDASRKDPDAPLMSATSYPGMEWNPYMVGGYDDLDEPAHK